MFPSMRNNPPSQALTQNDGWITLLNHDGSVHTPKWIGVQGANQRGEANLTTPLVLNQPYGIDIVNGVLYVADSNGNIPNTDPSTGGTDTLKGIRTNWFGAAPTDPSLVDDVAAAWAAQLAAPPVVSVHPA